MTALHRALVVTAVDFNGQSFDGCPVKPLFPSLQDRPVAELAPWFNEAIEKGQILVEARGNTDYAWFGVKDDVGNITWASPGDVIASVGPGGGRFIVIPQLIVKYMERLFRHVGLPLDIGAYVRVQADLSQFHGELRPLP